MPARKSLLELLSEEDFSSDKNQKNLTEFISEKKEIQDALAAHWAVRNIWKVLTKAGRITMPYSTFCRHVRSLSKTPKEETTTATAAQSATTKGEGFKHNPTPDPKNLI